MSEAIPPELIGHRQLFDQLRSEFPQFDADILAIFLEDAEFDYNRALELIRDEETMYAEFSTLEPEDKLLPFLTQSFPTAPQEEILFWVDACAGDLDQIRANLTSSGYIESSPELDVLIREFPDADVATLRECLNAAGGDVETALEWLTATSDPSQQSNRRPRKKRHQEVIEAFPSLPMGSEPKQKKQKKKKGCGLALLQGPQRDPVEELVALGCDRGRAIEALECCNGDLDRAANFIFMQECDIEASAPASESPVDILQSVFATTPREEIEETLEFVDGDIERAGAILEQRLSECPRLEDTVLAVRPDFSVDQARQVLRDAKGDIRRATAIAQWKPVPKVPRKVAAKKKLTVDLHGYRASEAYGLVSKALREVRADGSVAQISFITGKGLHSKSGIPVLRPLVLRLCRDMGFKAYVGANRGVVICDCQ